LLKRVNVLSEFSYLTTSILLLMWLVFHNGFVSAVFTGSRFLYKNFEAIYFIIDLTEPTSQYLIYNKFYFFNYFNSRI